MSWSAGAGIDAADPELAAALDAPAAALFWEMTEAQWPVDEVLAQLASLSADFENNRNLVTRAIGRLDVFAAESAVNRVAGAVADLEAALRRFQPQIAEELAVRGGPLHEQWEARGPGMLREIARLTEAEVIPDAAEIVLVSPFAGGHGVAYARQNRVVLEAVLTNPYPELPEAVRVAWLIAQLNSDLPRFADVIPTGQAARAFELAMLAPALGAAQAVELAACDVATLDLALAAWRLPGDLPNDAAAQIWQWWSAWLDHPGKWSVAVAALARLLAAI